MRRHMTDAVRQVADRGAYPAGKDLWGPLAPGGYGFGEGGQP